MSLKISPPHFTVPFSLFIFYFHLSFLATQVTSVADDPNYGNCSSRFICGDTVNVTYPFWGEARPSYCGVDGFKLGCYNNISPYLEFDRQIYSVLHIDETHRTMNISRMDLSYNVCAHSFQNTTIVSHTVFKQTSIVKNMNLFYGCLDPTSVSVTNEFTCPNGGRNASFFVEDSFLRKEHDEITKCSVCIKVPVLRSAIDDIGEGKLDIQGAMKKGFEVEYNVNDSCGRCELSGGMCGTKPSSREFVCYCRDKPHPLHCPSGQGGINLSKKSVIVGSSVAGTAMIAMIVGMLVFLKCRKRRQAAKHSYSVTRSITSSYSSRTGHETSEAYYGLPLFEYDELKEATNNFDPGKELGDGGFGTVFYGKLRDGRAVAVKRLFENNYKRTAQFMNEVEILARLHHPNLVHLYGCTSRQSYRLLLVYEYVPNGTVADHLHGDLAKPGSLPWLVRINIALETASALVYLHASDIVHRDVKTNNILLDENFKVKVADFGLSRLFPTNVTHVSTAPQGTPGYVDPEYHQCYQLTDKSDVYSFGVVLMELISSLPAVDIMRHRQEINLSTMAMNKIQSDALHELVDGHLGFESDSETRRMIEAVAELGFRCLQHGKDMRPSMAEVLSTLQGIVKQGTAVRENESPSDDVVLLKVGPLPLSPDSVMVKWASTNPTPNASA